MFFLTESVRPNNIIILRHTRIPEPEVASHMPVKIRLARYGAKKKPFYRVVVTESRAPRDGRFLEILGTYDPRNKIGGINLDSPAIKSWIARGAEVSDTVRKLLRKSTPTTD